jgi:hypothetical protein
MWNALTDWNFIVSNISQCLDVSEVFLNVRNVCNMVEVALNLVRGCKMSEWMVNFKLKLHILLNIVENVFFFCCVV